MKKTGIIAALFCAFALCLALVGCGGSSEADENTVASEAFAGTWDLTGMTQNGDSTDSEDIQMLSALGMKVTLSLNDDGTAKLLVFDSTMSGTWEAVDATTATATLDGQSVDMTISESGELTLSESGSTMTFKKGEAKSSGSASSADAAASDAAASDEATSDEAAPAEEAGAEEASSEASA
ncbi:MAG: hypothetical protein IJI68_07830 [Eggerthellaceae bacterium]|nr:hypothetical protein [Eggerthellaceae bacterium]